MGQQKSKKKILPTPYDRGYCLSYTKEFENKNGTIKIPRSTTSLEYLCRYGLKGKIHLMLCMSEDEIMDEIHSVFKRLFNNQNFSFSILQPGGEKLKSLVVPSPSSSYVWTASAVAGSPRTPIYILAHSDIDVKINFIVNFLKN